MRPLLYYCLLPVFILLLTGSAFAQNKTPGNLKTLYEGSASQWKGNVGLNFMTDFHDTVKVSLGKKVLFHKRITTQFSIDWVEQTISIDSALLVKPKHRALTVEYAHLPRFTIKVPAGYKFINVYLIDNKWQVNYSNTVMVLE